MSDYFKDFMSGRLQVQHYMESGFSGWHLSKLSNLSLTCQK
jgi:hypothetical protein